ncbi:MmgE/PrpD family protein [Paraburkholderia sp. RL17-337-BIB-A]|uniref:MmgE/PrpD family protein n=1 Tax=Paraburkholderia sp. RL17-337-BIB-A TaxID=3031636 RepID=UPI0038BA3C65
MKSTISDLPAVAPSRAEAARSVSERCASWAVGLQFDDCPDALREAARWRLLDTLGVGLAATSLPVAEAMLGAAGDLSDGADADVIGNGGRRVSVPWAALANGTLFHSLIFDDTHSETIVHPSSVVVAAALAAAQANHASGRDFLTAMMAGSEITCRIGLAAARRFHAAGFQPTAVVGPLGATVAAGKLYGLDSRQLAHALGIAGSFVSGIIESWTDGAWAQLLHAGWAAHSGIVAATLGRRGFSGPSTVIEGKAGVLCTHTRPNGIPFAFERITDALGERWESAQIAFKPFPCGHVIHPFLDALLALHREGLEADQVKRIVCPIADYMIPVVCSPVEQKRRPRTDAQARTSLQYSLAEALHHGRLDARSYQPESLNDPRILALADRVEVKVDDSAPDSRIFKGWVIVHTVEGRVLEKIVPSTRGSVDNPMSETELRDKFFANAALRLSREQAQRVFDLVFRIDTLASVDEMMRACNGDPRESPSD